MSTTPNCTGWCFANGRSYGCGMTVCPYYNPLPPPPPPLATQTTVALDPVPTYMRIAAALERIAAALERSPAPQEQQQR